MKISTSQANFSILASYVHAEQVYVQLIHNETFIGKNVLCAVPPKT